MTSGRPDAVIHRFIGPEQAWRDDARCRIEAKPTSFFFPSIEDPPTRYAEIVDYCRPCPVRLKCLDYAQTMRAHGYWGGMSEKSRKELRQIIGFPRPEIPVPHGTTTGYKRGCRDDCCREAHNVYMAEKKAARERGEEDP